ncbi:hypothetical protein ACKVV1_011103 [Pyricularia oryzae]
MVKAWKHLPAELEKIKLRVGERQYKSIQRARRRKMLLDFDTVKQSYEDDPTKDFEVDLKGVQDSKENGIEDETIAISASTMRTVFDHVCGQIENLIQKQLQSVEKEGKSAKARPHMQRLRKHKPLLTKLSRQSFWWVDLVNPSIYIID